MIGLRSGSESNVGLIAKKRLARTMFGSKGWLYATLLSIFSWPLLVKFAWAAQSATQAGEADIL